MDQHDLQTPAQKAEMVIRRSLSQLSDVYQGKSRVKGGLLLCQIQEDDDITSHVVTSYHMTSHLTLYVIRASISMHKAQDMKHTCLICGSSSGNQNQFHLPVFTFRLRQ